MGQVLSGAGALLEARDDVGARLAGHALGVGRVGGLHGHGLGPGALGGQQLEDDVVVGLGDLLGGDGGPGVELGAALCGDVELLAAVEQLARQLGPVRRVVAVQQRLLPQGDHRLGDVHGGRRGWECAVEGCGGVRYGGVSCVCGSRGRKQLQSS